MSPPAIEAEARALAERLAASRVLYAEVPDNGQSPVVRAVYGPDDPPSPDRGPLEDYARVVAERLRAGRTLVVENAVHVPILTAEEREAYLAAGARACLVVPLVRAGRLRAFLSVHHETPRAWTAEEVALAGEVAERTWAARAGAEEALRESESRYRALVDSIDEGFCVIEMLFDEAGRPRDYRFLEANAVFESQTGLVGAIGRTARELVPQLEARWFEIYGRVALTGEPVRFVEGSEAMGRWFDVYAFRFGPPESHRVALLFTDITGRRRAEAERERLAAQRQLALDAARLGWWHYDPVERLAWWDARYKEIAGITEDRTPVDAFLARVHPDDAPEVSAAIEAALDPATPSTYSVEYRIRRPDGSVRWVEAHGLASFEAHPEGRRATSLVGTVADISERKAAEARLRESERRFRSMADAAPAAVWVTEPDGSCSFLSRTWHERTGQGEAEALGFGWLDAVHPDDRPAAQEAFLAANARHEAFALNYRLRQANGDYRWSVDTGRPRLGPRGEFLGFIGTMLDIHDHKVAEEQLRQAAKMEAIGRLAGGIAHDFNNQLHALSGFASFVARDPGLGARSQRDLEEIRKAAERMAGLTRQLLAFSRQQVLQPETLQLNSAVLDASSLLQRLLGTDIEIGLDLTTEPTWIRVDPAQLLQVFMNLAINARDAMPGGGQLRIRTGRRDVAGQPHVLLSVADQGTGIAPEHLPHIFEPFFTTKEVDKGTGLGLATVHGIVSQSRGQVWVDSEPGQGATFTVLLPAAPRPDAASAGARIGRTTAAPPARIVVVDDEDIVRAVVSRTLEDRGYEVVQARSGTEALEHLAGARGVADLVLSDVVMPGLGGRELGERLAAEYPEVPVVWMSGYPRDSAFGEGEPAGGQSFLQKPIPEDVLVRTVQDVLARGERGPAGD
ncbi:MAG TPA: PAS domain S-box protein [Gemmatimonadales bacterium]|nr:PAS domain S-box protein [Gemmatimonadales bacterium]